jgi:hypothetical protein
MIAAWAHYTQGILRTPSLADAVGRPVDNFGQDRPDEEYVRNRFGLNRCERPTPQ